MQDGFASAAIAGEYRILGRKLQPLSAAHILVLDAMNSPVITGDPVSAIDLILAVNICATRVDLIRGVYLPVFTRDILQGKKPSWRDQMWAGLCCYEPLFHKQCETFAEYVKEYTVSPEEMSVEGYQPRPMSAPVVYSLAIIGMRFLSEDRVWSMPFSLLRTYCSVYAEAEGAKVRFVSDSRDIDTIEEQMKFAEAYGKKLEEEMLRQKLCRK
jgi:hypothetical protein